MTARAWYACSEPERPTDPYVVWHYEGCRGCGVKIDALLQQRPHDDHVKALAQRMGGAS